MKSCSGARLQRATPSTAHRAACAGCVRALSDVVPCFAARIVGSADLARQRARSADDAYPASLTDAARFPVAISSSARPRTGGGCKKSDESRRGPDVIGSSDAQFPQVTPSSHCGSIALNANSPVAIQLRSFT
jgi:hypothetical protein